MIQHEKRRRILLEAGTEGGSVGIAEYQLAGKTMFAYFVDECTADFLSDCDREGFSDAVLVETTCDSFTHALRFLEPYRWWLFVPLEVAPDFRNVIKDELVSRSDEWPNLRWKAYLDQSDGS